MRKKSRTTRQVRTKADKVFSAIRAERDLRISEGGFEYDGHWYQCDTGAIARIIGIAMVAFWLMYKDDVGVEYLLPFEPWETIDGAFVPLTTGIAVDLLYVGSLHISATFEAARDHMAAAALEADPEDYDFSGGWPVIYPG